MTLVEFSLLCVVIGYLAGLLGALTGLGGGVIIIPILVLLFHINIHYAMGAALLSVIATSSGSAAAFLREGFINIRIGIFLELAAAIGAVIGAYLTAYLSPNLVCFIFGLVLILSAYLSFRRNEALDAPTTSHPWAVKLKLDGTYPDQNKKINSYRVQNVPTAFSLLGIAGVLSGLLGIGSGAVKVLAMDNAMKLPYKVATSTSNFIIGITAAVGVGVYFHLGYIRLGLSWPIILGIVAGSFSGARLLTKVHTPTLRTIFSIVILLMAVQLILKSFGVTWL